MWSNRGYRWKLAAALAAVAAAGVISAWRGRDIHPAPWACKIQPERWDGARLWFRGTVRSAADGGFVIEESGVPLTVVGGPVPAAGEVVEVTGIFRAEGPHLELTGLRRVPPHARLRWLMEAVSIAVLLLVLWNFARRFAFHPEALRVEGAD